MATSGGEEAAAVAPAVGSPAPAGDTTPGWEVAVRPLLSASYSAFEMKELPQLVASVIERYRAAAPAGRVPGGGWEVVPEGSAFGAARSVKVKAPMSLHFSSALIPLAWAGAEPRGLNLGPTTQFSNGLRAAVITRGTCCLCSRY